MKQAATHTTYSYDVNNTSSNLYANPGNAQPQPVMAPSNVSNDYQYTNVPLLPPPLPPFTKSENYDVGSSYNDSYNTSNDSYGMS